MRICFRTICQIIVAYFQDDHANALRHDPALTAVVEKIALASQPTLSRFHNRPNETTFSQLEEINGSFATGCSLSTDCKTRCLICSNSDFAVFIGIALFSTFFLDCFAKLFCRSL